MKALSCVLFLCGVAAAQPQTFIVDAANGPGTHFTEIATAVATVPDGAVIEVRAGSYMAFGVASKGLSILFDPGATVWPSGAALVTATAPHQTVELRGMHKPQGDLQLTSCQGPVLLRGCVIGGSLRADGCTSVQADTCSFGAPQALWGVRLQNSHAAFANCTMASSHLNYAMELRSSSAQLVDCTVAMSAPALVSSVGMVVGSVRMVGGSISPSAGAAISGTGSARVDPSVAHQQLLFSSSLQSSILEMPAVVTAGGALGATVTATMRGPNGDVGAMLVGLPGPPLLVPGFADAFWLQPGTEAVCAFTVFATGVPLGVTYTVPNVPALRGMRFCWQGVTYGAVNGLQASNPAITTHW